MKKIALIFCALFSLCPIFIGDGNAETGVEVGTQTEQQQAINDSRQINIGNGDTFISPDFISPGVPLPSAIPPYPMMLNKGWQIWYPGKDNRISVKRMKRLANSSAKVETRIDSAFAPNQDDVQILTYYPEEVDEIGYCLVYYNKLALFEGLAYRGVDELKEGTNTKWMVVLFRSNSVNVAQPRVFGTAAVASAVLGPSDPTKMAGSVGAGSGWGTIRAWPEEIFEVRVIAFSGPGYPPPAISQAKKEPEKMIEVEPEKKQEAIPKKDIELALPAVYFDFDVPVPQSDQDWKFKTIARWLAENWQQIKASGRKVAFIGHCDNRGTYGYNNNLGMNRAISVSSSVALELQQLGISVEDSVQMIRYWSSGEYFAEGPQFDENRKVFVVLSDRISQ